MSVSRNYFNDRGRDRPGFNYRRNDRSFGGNIPTSRHSIFIRGFPASMNSKTVKAFFVDETRSNVQIDFVSYTDEHKKLCIAIRFDSHQIAKEMYNKYNNREILGHSVEFSWFKDMKAVKGRYNERRFRDRPYQNRRPRRFNDRSARSGSRNYRSRSKQRYRDSFEKKKDYKSRSHSRDSASSSSFSKSRSGSESVSASSSASPTRLIRNINKHKYKKKNNSDSYTSRDHSRDRSRYKSDDNSDQARKAPRSESKKPKEQPAALPTKAVPELTIEKEPELPFVMEDTVPITIFDLPTNPESDECIKIKSKSAELLDNYSRDIENYLNIINAFVGKNPDLEAPLVASLKDILNEIGEKYVYQFLKFIENVPSEIVTS